MHSENFLKTLEKAMSWANQNYPEESIQLKAAFANSVAYLVTGLSGGYGGPSLREHLVSWSVETAGKASPGSWTFEKAVAFSAPLCFSPTAKFLGRLAEIQEVEASFDDDPEDLLALRESRQGRSPLPSPEIQEIINSWLSGDYKKAIVLTNLYSRRSGLRFCKGINRDGSPCGKVLAPQAKGDYCLRHRHQARKRLSMPPTS
ncbi:MAG: hypothetical protein ACPL4I_11180 [Bacteroidota bacterium]